MPTCYRRATDSRAVTESPQVQPSSGFQCPTRQGLTKTSRGGELRTIPRERRHTPSVQEEKQTAFKEPRGVGAAGAEPAPTRKGGSACISQVRSGKSLGVQGKEFGFRFGQRMADPARFCWRSPRRSPCHPPASSARQGDRTCPERHPPVQCATADPTPVPQEKSLRGLLGSGAVLLNV